MSKIIAIAIEKGGVGKTTTAFNLGAGLAANGYKVLLIDVDHQGDLSGLLGFEPDGKPTIAELIYQAVSGITSNSYDDFIRHNTQENVDYIPSNKMLSGIYSILGADGESNTVLNRIFHKDYFQKYDYILFDCPPAVDNLLVSNVIQCADKLLLPVQAEMLAYNGITGMLERLIAIKQNGNTRDFILGMLVTMYKRNTNMSNDVLDAMRQSYGDLVFNSPIPSLQEAKNSTETRKSLVNVKNSKVGEAYRSTVKEVIERW